MHSAAWSSSAQDFGQKVDLTVRIREILRNYPEGLSILKELIQNADDAGARTIKFCAAETRCPSKSSTPPQTEDALSNVMNGPSLIAYNSAKFTETDFQSIQRIGDSLKKDKNGTKTGRFGVGINSTYHLTDVPMFASGSKIVMFDPQASFVPGINPANPGKMIDCAHENGRKLVQSLPKVFDPLRVFGCRLSGEDYDGTIFRFALRTESQAVVSRLSRQAHSLESIRELLRQMACAAPYMLLFLKNVECIEIYDWKSTDDVPILVSRTEIGNKSEKLQMRRSYVLNAPTRVPQTPQGVDFILDIESTGYEREGISDGRVGSAHKVERWIVCNQLGGGNASKMATDEALSHMKLIPWAGVAARLSPICEVDGGNAYCFLPLPVKTNLSIHVNGYFELSSNRRDVWWGDDMAGDGKARAEWNQSIVEDIAAPCYIRLVTAAVRTKQVSPETYEVLLPQKELSGPWKLLADAFMQGIQDAPILYSKCASGDNWLSPRNSVLMHDDNDRKMYDILSLDQLPLVLFQHQDAKKTLLQKGTCKNTTTPAFLRKYFSNRNEKENGCLEVSGKLQHAEFLLKYCKSELKPNQFSYLARCQFIPLANGNLGRFCVLPTYDDSDLSQLLGMGFSKLVCIRALRICGNNIDTSMEWLLNHGQSKELGSVVDGIDPFLVCKKDIAPLLRTNAADTFIDIDSIQDADLVEFFNVSPDVTTMNTLPFQNEMLVDVISRAVPANWRGKDSALWNADSDYPDISWFTDLWRYLCSIKNVKSALNSVAEKVCIVPTKQGIVCSLSPGNSVVDVEGLDLKLIECLEHAGARILFPGVLPSKIVLPSELYSYIYDASRDSIIRAIDACSRRTDDDISNLEGICAEMKDVLFQFFANNADRQLSAQCRTMVRKFPIFRRYKQSIVEYVSMCDANEWYVIEGNTSSVQVFMTPRFLLASTKAEAIFLISLGAKSMSKTVFFKNVIVPQLSEVNPDVADRVIQEMFLQFPSSYVEDRNFVEYLSNAKFIRSHESKKLQSPKDLYDPEIPTMLSLMGPDSFPDEFYCQQHILIYLRQLGLQSILSWKTVLECARSIEFDATCDDEEKVISAKNRGSELLMFLDMNVDTFFPDTAKSKQSKTGRFLSKVNAAFFEDSKKKKIEKEQLDQNINELLNIKWVPVHNDPPQEYLPWPNIPTLVAAPIESVLPEHMWLASYSKHLVNGDLHSQYLKNLFGWQNAISPRDVSTQLRAMSDIYANAKSQKYDNVRDQDMSLKGLCQKYSSEIGRIYHFLNSLELEDDIMMSKSILNGCSWLWMGDKFVSPDNIAYSSSIDARPYLYTVPPDLACFRNLLTSFRIREIFGPSDYCLVLNRMAKENLVDKQSTLTEEQVELAVNLVQKISDDVLRLGNLELYAPTENGFMEAVSNVVYDDTPWLRKDLSVKKGLVYAHPKLSASVCDKVGIKRIRNILLQENADLINFGDGIMHESFGQSESLTRRLKNIVEMYPEGSQQLNELIQNADDAKASIVKFVVSTKTHGTFSLLGQKMSEWQGGALYCYNDAVFTNRDFENLSEIGQASKLEKVATTGRFGLGFNSVFHWTDVPQIVSSDYLVMFDPHAKYVPGATNLSRGIKIRFTNTELASQFPDQMAPFCMFGNDMKRRFDGTIFRFPFRNEITARDSEISNKQYNEEVLSELIRNFRTVVSKTLLFLRNVRRIEVFSEHEGGDIRLNYYADVTGRYIYTPSAILHRGIGGLNLSANVSTIMLSDEYDDIEKFISGDGKYPISKESFYNKLLRTPESHLPKTKRIVSIAFVGSSIDENGLEGQEIIMDQYLVCSALGAGQCREMACNPLHRDFKFIPWASIAVHLSRNEEKVPKVKGNAFCFLPLPTETGFAVHINGYFELSANRRDIWHGYDMVGAGHIRSEWNRLLLRDVIAPIYCDVLTSARLLVGPGSRYESLWPINISSDIWNFVRSTVFSLSQNLPLMYTPREGGQWIPFTSSVLLENQQQEDIDISSNQDDLTIMKSRLKVILLQENLDIVSVSSSFINRLREESLVFQEISPQFVREWFKKNINHPSLSDREQVLFLLRYCICDLTETKSLNQLHGLPLLPLADQSIGPILAPSIESGTFYVVNDVEKTILEKSSKHIVDVWTTDTRINGFLRTEDFMHHTNVCRINAGCFLKLIKAAFPRQWNGLREVQWSSDSNQIDSISHLWLSKLWSYLGSGQSVFDGNVKLLCNDLQIVPTSIGTDHQYLQALTENMAVVDFSSYYTGKHQNEDIARISRVLGIRVLDVTVFPESDRQMICRMLENFVQRPSLRGILVAFSNLLPNNMLDVDTVHFMEAKFVNLCEDDRKILRDFFIDSTPNDLSPQEIAILRSFPIYDCFDLGGKVIVSHLQNDSVLPPSCAEKLYLNRRFVRASSSKDVDFFSQINVPVMHPHDYYINFVPTMLVGEQIEKTQKIFLVGKLLQDTARLAEDQNGDKFLSALSEIEVIPNCHGTLMRASLLYDPLEAGLKNLADDSMLPIQDLWNAGALQSLRKLGMRSSMDIDGIIECARRLEVQAKELSLDASIPESDVERIRSKAFSLLNFLDDDEFIQRVSGSDIIDDLKSIAWLPVDRPNVDSSQINPPRRIHDLSHIGISSPKMTRPRVDEWISSSTLDTLSVNIKSDALSTLFQWNTPPSLNVVAAQLVAISQLSSAHNGHASHQKISKVTLQIYEIIDGFLAISEEDDKQEVISIFMKQPWIWVGDRFVKTSQVAYNAPEHAKPYLYSVPDNMLCYENLLANCGIRESFNGNDFANLLLSLSKELQNRACDSKQLDLTVFVARSLSRIPHDELSTLDRTCFYLPCQNGILHNAEDMTYDDAPWLSAIVKKTKHIFVHPDITNEVARILGAKSLRDVLSANQNGMVKIPCPKFDALHQLLKNRDISHVECCRTVLELIEIAEMRGTKQVSIALDKRTHGTMSLVHPCLDSAQGPALILSFHGVAMEVDEVIRLTSPAKYYSSTTSGSGGGGGIGFPRFGRGLCAAFALTDCLQILTGRSLLLFDPTGNYLIEDNVLLNTNEELILPQSPDTTNTARKIKANARNYALSSRFCNQFPDQFYPFFSVSSGAKECVLNGENREGSYFQGTIIRIPLRTSSSLSPVITDFVIDDFEKCLHILEEGIPRTLLFSFHLQNLSLSKWENDGKDLKVIISTTVSSSPLVRRSHLEEQSDLQSWRKGKNKFSKLFKSSWTPKQGFYLLELSTQRSDEDQALIDTYAVHSILAPPRLREMACTESLKGLNLIPTLSISTHIRRSIGKSPSEVSFNPPKGTIFVGFDTGIETGLPFNINAPLFLHEWNGSVLLEDDDDAEFRATFPGIRNVNVKDADNIPRTRALSLYVWNRQALTSAIKELVPTMIVDVKVTLERFWPNDGRIIYRFWPYRQRVKSPFKDILDADVYSLLAEKSTKIYLTKNSGFLSSDGGYFPSPLYEMKGAAGFFAREMNLFIVPKLLVNDLIYFGVNLKQVDPSFARRLLKMHDFSIELSKRPTEVHALLKYCLADLSTNDRYDLEDMKSLTQEIAGLRILPLTNGRIGKIGDRIIVANAEQQEMMPMLRHKYLSLDAVKILEPFLSNNGFKEGLCLEDFGPKVLAEYMNYMLPSDWEGKDFVKWDPELSSNVPSKLWIYQFWKEVSLSNHDDLHLFRRWPLIPTSTGELASCGNARYILYIGYSAIDQELDTHLTNAYRVIMETAQAADQKALEQNGGDASLISTYFDETFWNLGNAEVEEVDGAASSIEIGTNIDGCNDIEGQQDQSNYSSNNQIPHSQPHPVAEGQQPSHDEVVGYETGNSAIKELYSILHAIECPLIDATYFDNRDLQKICPADRLGVSRSIMSTLYQCIHYWHSSTAAMTSEGRLKWSTLDSKDFDHLLSLLSSHGGNRLSLMISDLSLMKHLPIFETIGDRYISLNERDKNFAIKKSVNFSSMTDYLPLSLQCKLLTGKDEFEGLYEDLNVEFLNEATILSKFILKEFSSMPLSQKESVIKNILSNWVTLSASEELLNELKNTAFVKRRLKNDGEITFVRPSQVFDPRHHLLKAIFDNDKSLFPAEEFQSTKALEILERVGLQRTVDKETFLMCASVVEKESNIHKAILLLEYFSEHFGEFYDGNKDFCSKLSEIQFVPCEVDGGDVTLHRFCDAAAPKDRHLVYRVMPVIYESCTPPQVLFSAIGITSPPPISQVLKQVRALTNSNNVLEHWTYKHGSIEQVFSSIFSFLQDVYDDLSPRVKEALADRPLIPVGSSFVKANQLFFRLAKDLSPFFYEVPRAFGAHEVFFRNLGVRETPASDDYAVSLMEMKKEIGSTKLNANELLSVIEVVNLAASEKQNTAEPNHEIYAPDHFGRLVNAKDLMQNDWPWLTQSGRIDLDYVHFVHPKLGDETCQRLDIKKMSEKVIEVRDPEYHVQEVDVSNIVGNVINILKSDIFIRTISQLIPKKDTDMVMQVLQRLRVTGVENIRTRFILIDGQGNVEADISNPAFTEGPLCFIDGENMLLTPLVIERSYEIVVATCICQKFHVSMEHAAGLATLLASNTSTGSGIETMLRQFGLSGKNHSNEELFRGQPGFALTTTDLELIEVKPLKTFQVNEIVAVRQSIDSTELVYGTICQTQDSSALSRLRVCVGEGIEKTFLSSQVYSLKRGRSANTEKTDANIISTRKYTLNHNSNLLSVSLPSKDIVNKTNNENNEAFSPVIQKEEILSAVDDLLRTADMRLNDDAKKLMSSNLLLKENLSKFQAKVDTLRISTKNVLKGIDSFLCPITREVMEDPVIASDGHTYEREAIEMWFRNNRNPRSPKTNQVLSSTQLFPNYALKNAIEAMDGLRESLNAFSAS